MAHNIRIWMEERPSGGWRWCIRQHIEGPDDVLNWQSEFFETKKECLLDMHTKYLKQLDELAKDYD